MTGTNEVHYNSTDNILLHYGDTMRIKADDLRMLMEYVDKELVEHVDITVVATNFGVYFEFRDADDRECEIALYEENMGKPPQLTKKMQLLTRIKKEDQ